MTNVQDAAPSLPVGEGEQALLKRLKMGRHADIHAWLGRFRQEYGHINYCASAATMIERLWDIALSPPPLTDPVMAQVREALRHAHTFIENRYSDLSPEKRDTVAHIERVLATLKEQG